MSRSLTRCAAFRVTQDLGEGLLKKADHLWGGWVYNERIPGRDRPFASSVVGYIDEANIRNPLG